MFCTGLEQNGGQEIREAIAKHTVEDPSLAG